MQRSKAWKPPSQKALHEDQVEPAIELAPHLAKVRHLRKPQLLMKFNRCSVVGVDAGDEDMLPQSGGSGNERFQQSASQAAAALPASNVHGMLDGISIAGPGSKVAERSEAHDLPVRDRDQDRIPLFPSGSQPHQAIFQ